MTKNYEELIADMTKIMAQVHERAFEMGYKQAMFDAEGLAEIGIPPTIDEMMELGRQATETPQEKRDRIVEQAKDDVEGLRRESFSGNLYDVYDPTSPLTPFRCEEGFVVNKDKRTVVAIMRGVHSGKIRAKGIAKCAPGDCFNVHIGRAIALRRALGLEVSAEYLNAPQPTEVRVGDVIRAEYTDFNGEGSGKFYEEIIKTIEDDKISYESGHFDFISVLDEAKIIDDSREGVTQ